MYEFLLTVQVLAAVIWVGGGVMMLDRPGPELALAPLPT